MDIVSSIFKIFDEEYAIDEVNDCLLGYTDIDDLSENERLALSWAVSSGMLKGTSGSELSPRASLTKAQAVIMLLRCVKDYNGTELPEIPKETIKAYKAYEEEKKN